MKRILFVDDEANVLDGLRRMLRSKRGDWEMEFSESGAAALVLLEQARYDVVVSDMKMPGMDGAELLKIVQEKHPHTVRIILSGHSEKEALLRSVRCTHQFVSKPCDADFLRGTLERAFALRDRLGGSSVRELVAKLEAIPAVPSLYRRVMTELESPNCSLRLIGDLIEKDAGMSSSLLKLVNSAYFGLPSRISSVQGAVSFLGVETVTALILGVPLFHECGDVGIPGYSVEAVWQRSVMAAAGSKAIAQSERLDKRDCDDAFLAGLLHNIGQIVLVTSLRGQYAKVLQKAASATSLSACEREVFGTTHGEIAGYLLGLWGLPDPVVDAVAFHDEPLIAPNGHLTTRTIVRAAALLVREQAGQPTPLDAEAEAAGVSAHLDGWRRCTAEILRAEVPS